MSESLIWESCLDHFKKTLSLQQFNAWIKPLTFTCENEVPVINAPNSFTLKIVQERFLPEIQRITNTSGINNKHFIFRVNEKSSPKEKEAEPKNIESIQPVEEKSIAVDGKRIYGKLNSSLTFDNFVIGKANQLAFAAATQVAEAPGASYNPLFIYGGVGLGKTHLAQAIANKVKENRPNSKICYMHAERYISDVVSAYRTNKFEEFKQYYHSLDILIIDDIQFFAGKSKTQEEFFYAFNTLIDTDKQVILTSDTFPKEITGLDTRLISRLGWGLTICIEPPELEMRVAILLKKAAINGYNLHDSVAFFIAKNVNSNVRELEGALKRVEAFAKFHRQEITVEAAKDALKDLLVSQNKSISIENIQKTVADYFRIKLLELLSKKRTRNIARPRQIAMAIARELTSLSLPEIGSAFGGKDHSTVIHACNTVKELRLTDTTVDADYKVLIQTLKG